MTEITELMTDDIVVRDRLRGLNPDVVERLKESINSIGFKTPLSVRFLSDDDGYQLVTGRHRLQAAIELEMKWVPVREETGTELDAKLWEIAENLHRAELTALERDVHITEWIRLVEEREKQSAQLAPKGPVGHRPRGGINAASRDLGIERTAAQRAVVVGKLHPEAKTEAISLGLDDNQSALVRAAKETTKEAQIRALRERHARKTTSPKPPIDPQTSDAEQYRIEQARKLIEEVREQQAAPAAAEREAQPGGVVAAAMQRSTVETIEKDIIGWLVWAKKYIEALPVEKRRVLARDCLRALGVNAIDLIVTTTTTALPMPVLAAPPPPAPELETKGPSPGFVRLLDAHQATPQINRAALRDWVMRAAVLGGPCPDGVAAFNDAWRVAPLVDQNAFRKFLLGQR